MSAYEPRCKVCTSQNRKYFEDWYLNADVKPKWMEMEEQAKVFGEEISYKAFERHFSKHFSEDIAELVGKEADVAEVVKQKKQEVINLVDEIKDNLLGLKALLTSTLQTAEGKQLSPAMIRSLTDLYREHRQTLESCERLSSRLSEASGLSETEMLRFMYRFAKGLCPECVKSFKESFDDYLRVKKNARSL